MSTHHAVLFVGDRDSGIQHALAFFGVSGEEYVAHPDVQISILEHLGIDEARALKHTASLLPLRESVRSFVMYADRLTGEAQNALLKLFEDPPATARFALIVPSEELVIPTLRSRLAKQDVVAGALDTTIAQTFLASSYDDRLKEITNRTKMKDDVWVRTLLAGLEVLIHERAGDARREALREVSFVEQYAGVRGSSTKILLEHIALSLPHER